MQSGLCPWKGEIMNVRSYIAEHLTEIVRNGPEAEASIVFGEDFSVFRGHFPGNPTLPGVCELICVEVLLEKIFGKTAALTDLSKAKFFSPIAPEEPLKIELSGLPADSGELSGADLSARLVSGSRKIAVFTKFRVG